MNPNFFFSTFLCLLCLLNSSLSHASALIKVEGGVIHVISRFVYSGPALTDEIAEASTREIRKMWNEQIHFVEFEGKPHRVVFDIDYTLDNPRNLQNADSCAYNYVDVRDREDAGSRSVYYLGGNNGIFYTSDNLGHSSTVAHEYGHGLGLEHNEGYQEDAEVPGIMFARGTLVKSKFRYNPKAVSGDQGGTLNPVFRKVRKEDVRQIDFNQVYLTHNFLPWMPRYGCLGSGRPEKISGH